MPKKKRVVKRKAPVKSKSSARPKAAQQGNGFSNFKLGRVVRNLVLFVLLFLISYILSVVLESEVFSNIFYFLWIVFAFISLAFFIALLALLVLKGMRR
jgi:uncharacterized Tic20 family protein